MAELPLVPYYPQLTSMQQIREVIWGHIRAEVRRWTIPTNRRMPDALESTVLNLGRSDQTYAMLRALGYSDAMPNNLHNPIRGLFRDAANDLVLAGILRRSDNDGAFTYGVTVYGFNLFRADDPLVSSDPEGIGATFLREFGAVDRAPLLASYLGQASKCARQGMELAGATMIGCAYELAVVQLADAVVGRWPDFRVGDLTRDHKKTLESYVEVRKAVANGERPPRAPGAATLFDAVHGALMEARKATPPQLHAYEDWIRVTFPASFAYVREMRNDAGHPSGHKVDLDDLRDHVSRFVRDYRRVRGIIDTLS